MSQPSGEECHGVLRLAMKRALFPRIGGSNVTDRYEVVGALTREQAMQVAKLLAGSSVIWCKGHMYPCDGIVIRPAQSADACMAKVRGQHFDERRNPAPDAAAPTVPKGVEFTKVTR